METPILSLRKISYSKNSREILKDVNLEIHAGHFIGLVGSNGAGKTTLMRLIMNLAKPNAGTVKWNEKEDILTIKANVSFSDDLSTFPKGTTIHKAVDFYEQLYPDFSIARYNELAEFLELEKNQKIIDLSKGMRERLTIALTLARDAKLYMLDEPFSGIDSMSRKKIIKMLIKWVSADATLIISSHHINEISQILDELIIVKDKTILEHRSTEEIIETEHNSLEEYFEQLY